MSNRPSAAVDNPVPSVTLHSACAEPAEIGFASTNRLASILYEETYSSAGTYLRNRSRWAVIERWSRPVTRSWRFVRRLRGRRSNPWSS